MPIYVNMVRDPVERLISWFNFIRAPWSVIEMIHANPGFEIHSPAWFKKVLLIMIFLLHLRLDII